jgi:hypothetical protein
VKPFSEPCERNKEPILAILRDVFADRRLVLEEGIGRVLADGGLLVLYGPFNYGGQFTSESNARFDTWLKDRDPVSGIRDFEKVDALAHAQGLRLIADHEMPANNRTLVWRRLA